MVTGYKLNNTGNIVYCGYYSKEDFKKYISNGINITVLQWFIWFHSFKCSSLVTGLLVTYQTNKKNCFKLILMAMAILFI